MVNELRINDLVMICKDGILDTDELKNTKLTETEKSALNTYFSIKILDDSRDIILTSSKVNGFEAWLKQNYPNEVTSVQAQPAVNSSVADNDVNNPTNASSINSATTVEENAPQEAILSTEEVDSSKVVTATKNPDVVSQGETSNRKKAEKLADNLGKFQKAENTLGGAIAGGLAGLALVKLGAKLGAKLGFAGGAIGSIIGGIAGALLGAAIAYIGTNTHLDEEREDRIDNFEQLMPPEPSNDESKVVDQQSEPATSPQLETTPLVTPSSSEVVPQANPVPEIVVANLTPPPESASADDAEDDKKAGQVDESEDSKSDKDVKTDETKEEKGSDKKDEELEEEK